MLPQSTKQWLIEAESILNSAFLFIILSEVVRARDTELMEASLSVFALASLKSMVLTFYDMPS